METVLGWTETLKTLDQISQTPLSDQRKLALGALYKEGYPPSRAVSVLIQGEAAMIAHHYGSPDSGVGLIDSSPILEFYPYASSCIQLVDLYLREFEDLDRLASIPEVDERVQSRNLVVSLSGRRALRNHPPIEDLLRRLKDPTVKGVTAVEAMARHVYSWAYGEPNPDLVIALVKMGAERYKTYIRELS